MERSQPLPGSPGSLSLLPRAGTAGRMQTGNPSVVGTGCCAGPPTAPVTQAPGQDDVCPGSPANSTVHTRWPPAEELLVLLEPGGAPQPRSAESQTVAASLGFGSNVPCGTHGHVGGNFQREGFWEKGGCPKPGHTEGEQVDLSSPFFLPKKKTQQWRPGHGKQKTWRGESSLRGDSPAPGNGNKVMTRKEWEPWSGCQRLPPAGLPTRGWQLWDCFRKERK